MNQGTVKPVMTLISTDVWQREHVMMCIGSRGAKDQNLRHHKITISDSTTSTMEGWILSSRTFKGQGKKSGTVPCLERID